MALCFSLVMVTFHILSKRDPQFIVRLTGYDRVVYLKIWVPFSAQTVAGRNLFWTAWVFKLISDLNFKPRRGSFDFVQRWSDHYCLCGKKPLRLLATKYYQTLKAAWPTSIIKKGPKFLFRNWDKGVLSALTGVDNPSYWSEPVV